MLARGIPVSGSDARAVARRRGAARPRAPTCTWATRPSRWRGADTVVVSTAVRDGQPRGRRGAAARAAAAAAVGGPGVGDAGPPRGRGRRHPRQDHHDLAAHRRAAGAAAPTRRSRSAATSTSTGSNAHDGTGEIFVAEADESDGAFLVYSPHAAVVTNVEADHLDNYGTEEAYRAAFSTFLDRIRPGGFLVAVVDDPGAAALADGGARAAASTSSTVGESGPADLRAVGPALRGDRLGLRGRRGGDAGSAGCACRSRGATTSSTRWRPWPPGCGSASASTSCAAGSSPSPAPGGAWSSRARWAACASTTATPTTPTRSPATCRPPGRWPASGRVVVAFQPHLVSRTRIFGPAMGEALGAADEVVVMDVYVAREDPEPGVNGALVASHVPLPPERGALRAVVVGHAGGARPDRPARRPRPHPRCRRRDAGRARGAACSSRSASRRDDAMPKLLTPPRRLSRSSGAPRGTGRPGGGPPRAPASGSCDASGPGAGWSSRRVLAVLAVVGLVVGGGVAGVLLLGARRAPGRRCGGPTCSPPPQVEPRPPCRRTCRSRPRDLGAIAGPRRGPGRRWRSVEVSRAWPDTIRIDVTERQAVAVVDWEGSWRGLDEEGVLFRTYPKQPGGAARARDAGHHPVGGARRGRAGRRRCPADSVVERLDHVAGRRPSTTSPS